MEDRMTNSRKAGEPRIAIASVGLGRIQRGYERHTRNLFEALRGSCNVELFKSAGSESDNEKIPAFLGPLTSVCRLLPFEPIAGVPEYRRYKNDCCAFSLTLLPYLLRNEFDIVHVVDYFLATILVRLRQMTRFPARLIFTDGGLMPPQYYPRADHIHFVAEDHFRNALAFGMPANHLSLIPCGFHSRRFPAEVDRSALRQKYGISNDTFVILSVSALNRHHKRVQHIIDEVSRMSGDFFLWLDGRAEDSSLAGMAREKLGDRCRITHVPSEEVAELYGVADVFVHAATEEAFGLAICEAAASGTMVLVHDSPHFQWLIGDRDCLIDMKMTGALAEKLRRLASHRAHERKPSLAASIRNRFDWDIVAPRYIEMYRNVAGMMPLAGGSAM